MSEQAGKAEVGPTEDATRLHKPGTREGLVSAFYKGEESLKNAPWITEGGRKTPKVKKSCQEFGSKPGNITELKK